MNPPMAPWFAWVGWTQWRWKILNPLRIRPVRQLKTWNFCPDTQISHHESSHGTLGTSNPTEWTLPRWSDMEGSIESENFKIHRNPILWARSWHEIWAPEHKFHVVTPKTAPRRPPIQLTGAWHMGQMPINPLKVKISKSIGIPSCEQGHDVKFEPRNANLMSWLLWRHLGDLGSNWLGHDALVWGGWVNGRWEMLNPLETHLVRQLITWNFPKLSGCNGFEKSAMHWKSTQWDSSWCEMCAL